MNRAEFTQQATAVLRSTVGWQTRIAEVLGVSPRQVRRWLTADAVPEWAAKALLARTAEAAVVHQVRDDAALMAARYGNVHGMARSFALAYLQGAARYARAVDAPETQAMEALVAAAETVPAAVFSGWLAAAAAPAPAPPAMPPGATIGDQLKAHARAYATAHPSVAREDLGKTWFDGARIAAKMCGNAAMEDAAHVQEAFAVMGAFDL